MRDINVAAQNVVRHMKASIHLAYLSSEAPRYDERCQGERLLVQERKESVSDCQWQLRMFLRFPTATLVLHRGAQT